MPRSRPVGAEGVVPMLDLKDFLITRIVNGRITDHRQMSTRLPQIYFLKYTEGPDG